MTNSFKISDLSIGYNKKCILENINLNEQLGQFITLIGRNGEGKSTLIKTLTSLIKPIKGDVLLDDKSILNIIESEKSKLISVVLTNKIEISNITVIDFIAFGRYPYNNWLGINSNQDFDLINQAINLCSINHLKHKFYSDLSDGEKQKVNIARVIAQNTPIIILDEPTAHLDLVNKIEVFKLLKDLVEKHQKTIILSTHQIELALQVSDKIWMINNQKIISDTPQNLKKDEKINELFSDTIVSFNTETNSFSIK